ncbi:MAG: LPS-assembly protein LptD [Pirellulales bacterium]|nr:LPS-assembly protein LptD [Pirellulales bacterium]
MILSSFSAIARGETALIEPDRAAPIAFAAEAANRWKSGAYDVWILRGNCFLQQGDQRARCREAVLWIEPANRQNQNQNKVIAYLEGDVLLEGRGKAGPLRISEQAWLGRYSTTSKIQPNVRQTAGEPAVMPPIFQRGMDRRRPIGADALTRSEVLPAQFVQPDAPLTPVGPPPATGNLPGPLNWTGPASAAGTAAPPGAIEAIATPAALPDRRIRVYPRGEGGFQAQGMPDPTDPNGKRAIVTINSGVNVIVDHINMNVEGIGQIDSIDVSADRAIIWTILPKSDGIMAKEGIHQDPRIPLELYLEGNIVFRQGEREIFAQRMYYDVPNKIGTILDAELLTPLDKYVGKIRLKTDVLQQTGEGQFYARNSFVTSSRMGEPGYRLQSGDIYFEDLQRAAIDPLTRQPQVDPLTNQPVIAHESLATSSNNFLFLGPVPVFYYPYLATDLREPTFYIRRARVKQDNVYGTQVLTNWSGYELLGIKNAPEGTDLDLSVDYLGKRGWAGGGTFAYGFEDALFGIPERTGGLFDFWYIHDNGRDNLGVDRPSLLPEKIDRFRLFGQHRQVMNGGYQISAEVGWISDRNFLQSFYQQEWDELKDQTTDVELKYATGNMSMSLFAGARLNEFFTQTEWLPRADHYWLGQPLLNDTFTWYEHTNIAYARFQPATAPTNPNDRPFAWLPWEVTPPFATSQTPAPAAGQRLATRQEIDYPFQLGALKIVPYALGEAANWGEDLQGNGLTRLYGQGGVRLNLPVWSVNPAIEDELFNVHGIAHKVNFTAEYAYCESNKDLSLLPLYDPLDDDSIEAGRRRNRVYDYGSPPAGFPPRYDERYYAVRSGLGGWVTSPSTEVLDTLSVFRVGAEQRWQTKRGAPGNQHIIDWVTLDAGINLYTNPDRDNFGTVPGLANYDFRWHVGDQTTLVSDGVFDFFGGGQNIYSVGAFLTRPPRGSFYVGYHYIDGPIQNRVVSLSYSYWMSPKWVSTFGTSIDLGNQGNIGQNFSITRIGESLLINLGFNVDPSRNSTGVLLSVEPRFLSKSRLANRNGVIIPPAGATGLE